MGCVKIPDCARTHGPPGDAVPRAHQHLQHHHQRLPQH